MGLRNFLRRVRKTKSNFVGPLSETEQAFIAQYQSASLLDADDISENDLTLLPSCQAFIGRDPSRKRPPIWIGGSFAGPDRNLPFKAVTFYTDDERYSAYAQRLAESAQRFGVEVHAERVSSKGSWEFNCAYKSRFVQDAWRKSDVPIVWVDADATFESDPLMLRRMSCDFAVHRWKDWKVASGTVYFGKTDLAEELLDAWVKRCEADPGIWDQIHLDSAWADISAIRPLKSIWLPQSYYQIFDGGNEKEPTVVKHWQASRLEKQEGRAAVDSDSKVTKYGRAIRTAPIVWRSQTQAFWIREGTDHIIPNVGAEFPEGFDVYEALRESLGDARVVLEVGCGVGRLAALFPVDSYIGIDINPNAVKAARARLPTHNLHLHDIGLVLPEASAAFVYTVLLHVPDDEIDDRLQEISEGRDTVVIAETMDPRWRRAGDPPVFNRAPEEYARLMARLGFAETHRVVRIYERYNTVKWRKIASPEFTFLTFKRK